jgi:cellulose synthase/poly-beta-1,6-N-acetylglucosamine synthase-like glycosyltransferase
MTPKVTFVVPCYKLAHLLPECVNSMRPQTYSDSEKPVMDDTPQVTQTFHDPRAKCVPQGILED